jgi:hypothetical protein
LGQVSGSDKEHAYSKLVKRLKNSESERARIRGLRGTSSAPTKKDNLSQAHGYIKETDERLRNKEDALSKAISKQEENAKILSAETRRLEEAKALKAKEAQDTLDAEKRLKAQEASKSTSSEVKSAPKSEDIKAAIEDRFPKKTESQASAQSSLQPAPSTSHTQTYTNIKDSITNAPKNTKVETSVKGKNYMWPALGVGAGLGAAYTVHNMNKKDR